MWVPNTLTVVVSAVSATFGIICIIKDQFTGDRYDKHRSAKNKVVVVTGANRGIGREIAFEFANREAKVFMACRDMVKCEEARREIVLSTQNKYVYCRPCNMASQESIRQFVETFKSEEPHLHILVNNAAVMGGPRKMTKEGIEAHLGVNYMGHFLLTNLLLPLMKDSAPSRIINMTSTTYYKSKIDKEDLNFENNYDPEEAYNRSKLAMVLFTNELATRLLGTKVNVYSVNPGIVNTELEREMPWAKSWTRFLYKPFFWFITKKPRMAAQTVVHAGLDPSLEKLSGEYLVDMKVTPQAEIAQDIELSQWLWKVSERWTRLDVSKANIQSNTTKDK